jgi:hypothetical protein
MVYDRSRACIVFTLSLKSLRHFLRLLLFFAGHPSRVPSLIFCLRSLGIRETLLGFASCEVRTYEHLLFLMGCMSAESYLVWRKFDGPQSNINKPLIPWRSPGDLYSSFKTEYVPSSLSHYKAYDFPFVFSFDFLLFLPVILHQHPRTYAVFTPSESEELSCDLFPLRYELKNS